MLDGVRRLLQRVLKVTDEAPEVPLGEKPEVFRASPKFLTWLLVQWGLKNALMFVAGVVPAVATSIAIVVEGKVVWLAPIIGGLAVSCFVVHAALSYLAIRLDYDHRWYVLTDRALRIREGIWLIKEVTLTLANVQDIKVSQGPVQRLLGLQDVVVDTAGGGGASAAEKGSVGGHNGLLRGVNVGSALVDKIRSRVQQRKGAGLGDPDDHHDHDHDAVVDVNAELHTVLRALRDESQALRQTVG